MNFRIRGHPSEIHVRVALQGIPWSTVFARRFGVEHEHAQTVVTESVLDAMEMLGSAYVTKMTRVVGRMTQLREAIHLVYEKVLNGTTEALDTAAMAGPSRSCTRRPGSWPIRRRGPSATAPPSSRCRRAAVGAATSRARDAAGSPVNPWRQRPGAAATREPQYPGARPGVGDRPTRAPRDGEPIRGGRREEVA